MEATAPTAAPEETPMMEGSAIGFLKKPCMTTPAVARAKPTTAASAMRGIRTRWTMISASCGTSNATPGRASRTTCATVVGGIVTGPIPALTTITTAQTVARPADHPTARTRTSRDIGEYNRSCNT
jgi:hypothetical protein